MICQGLITENTCLLKLIIYIIYVIMILSINFWIMRYDRRGDDYNARNFIDFSMVYTVCYFCCCGNCYSGSACIDMVLLRRSGSYVCSYGRYVVYNSDGYFYRGFSRSSDFYKAVCKKALNGRIEATNAPALIGKYGIVTEEINNIEAVGAVKIDGKIWTARSSDEREIIKEGAEVKILDIQGVKLIVKTGE